jgi:hypothetical protein
MVIKITTEDGSQYLIDSDTRKAMRIRGNTSNKIDTDGEWFNYSYFRSLDREAFDGFGLSGDFGIVEIGKSIYFKLSGHRSYDWIVSTKVYSIEEDD